MIGRKVTSSIVTFLCIGFACRGKDAAAFRKGGAMLCSGSAKKLGTPDWPEAPSVSAWGGYQTKVAADSSGRVVVNQWPWYFTLNARGKFPVLEATSTT